MTQDGIEPSHTGLQSIALPLELLSHKQSVLPQAYRNAKALLHKYSSFLKAHSALEVETLLFSALKNPTLILHK